MAEYIKRIEIKVPPEFVDLIDDWRRKQKEIPNRSEAIRQLCEKAIRDEQDVARRGS
jgi:metal-responsive CopG/Arc/MetJ family transcriptional regulator